MGKIVWGLRGAKRSYGQVRYALKHELLLESIESVKGSRFSAPNAQDRIRRAGSILGQLGGPRGPVEIDNLWSSAVDIHIGKFF